MKNVLNCLLILFVAVLFCGCSAEQIARLEAVAIDAQAKVDLADSAIAKADHAVAAAQALAEQLGIEKAQPIIAQAQEALAVARDAKEAAKATDDAASSAAAAAKQAQEAGGGTVGVIVAGLLAFLTGGAAAIPAITKAIANGRALVQTVRGLDAAREKIGEAEWKAKIAPSLEAAQDESVKTAVKLAQVKKA